MDDKRLGRPLAKDRQEIIRFIEAYKQREGHLPNTVAIQRYDPKTGVPTHTELYTTQDFLPLDMTMMEHKAFLFDHETFGRELRSILEGALGSGDCTGLVSFINANLANLKDPYEGEPLTDDWEDLIETRDAHQYGDFALTKYYDPKADLGLGADWDQVQQVFAGDSTISDSPVLGKTIGPPDDPFDPGKMGAYFQSEQKVQRNYSYLTGLGGKHPTSALSRALQMLKEAVDAGTGLYVTF